MNTLRKLLFLVSIFTILTCSCGKRINKDEIPDNSLIKITPEREKPHVKIDEQLLIKENGVDIFEIGKSIPFNAENYTINKEMVTLEEAIEEPIYIVYENEQEILTISPEYDYHNEEFIDKIGKITILSDKFKTAEGIGVGSGIKDFKCKYPDFDKIYFSYIGWHFWIKTNLNKFSFELDSKDYIGVDIIFDSDLTIINMSDFKEDSKIIAIVI